MLVETSNGDIIDRFIILIIKATMVKSGQKLVHINAEMRAIADTVSFIGIPPTDPDYLELMEVNQKIWDIEDAIRDKEAAGQFDDKFIQLARGVYQNNDLRASIKRRINERTGSNFIEEKGYDG